jgi:type I restriction enzyme S subunit
MNAELLLAHFNRISGAPDSVAHLRQFVLELAVRGKLVDAESCDQPASVFLKQIKSETAKRVREGQIKPRGPFQKVDQKEVPFEIPGDWSWTRIGVLSEVIMGQSPPGESYNKSGEGLPLINGPVEFTGGAFGKTVINQYTTSPTNLCEEGDLLLCVRGSTTGRTNIAGYKACIGRGVAAIRSTFDDQFLRLFIWRQRASIIAMGRGIAFPSISRQQIEEIPIPVPPLAQQGRIVAKVDELMALCDRLEATQREQETRRDQLTASTHHHLNNGGDGDELRNHAQFFIGNLPRLTARADQIKQLRQTILNLAVRGKLVNQESADQPATRLLDKIRAERLRPRGGGQLKKDTKLSKVNLSEAPFELPVGWAWARFPEIGFFGRGKSKHRPRNDAFLFKDGTHLLIQTGDVARSNGLITTYTNKYSDAGLAQSLKWPRGTLCITIAANIADSGILSFDACFPDSVVGFIPESIFPNARYFEYFIRTAKANLLEFAPATAQKNINLEILNAVLIPLPPLAEQHRIVAKVDELMTLCDQLEVSLTTAQAEASRLLESVLHHALQDATLA